MSKLAGAIEFLFVAPGSNAHVAPPIRTAEQLADRTEHDRRRKNYLYALTGVWLTFGAATLLSIPVYEWQIASVIGAGTALTFVIVRSLIRRERLAAACVTFCACVALLFLTIFLVQVGREGAEEAFRTRTSVLMLMGISALFAGALIGPSAAFIVAAINTVAIVGMRLLLAPDVDPRPSVVVFGWLLAAISFLYERTLRNVFAQLRDIRLGLETAVQNRTAELRDSVARLQSTTEQLTAANRDLEFFCASVAHDLRGPLLAIDGYSRMLQEAGVAQGDARSAELLQRMLNVESRMSRLIDGLLAFARLGHHELKRQHISMDALAQRVAGELRGIDTRINITVESLPDCFADPLLIEQVLVNLLSNAIKFTRPRDRPEIRVCGWLDGGEVIYSVRDNGVGFSMRDADRLFTTLQRLHPQEQFEGTGIGLTTVQRIVSRHGGRVWARGAVDAGAEFFFSLPRALDQATTGALGNSSPSGSG